MRILDRRWLGDGSLMIVLEWERVSGWWIFKRKETLRGNFVGRGLVWYALPGYNVVTDVEIAKMLQGVWYDR